MCQLCTLHAVIKRQFFYTFLETEPFGKINEYCYKFTYGLLYVLMNTQCRFFWLIMSVTFCWERMSQV